MYGPVNVKKRIWSVYYTFYGPVFTDFSKQSWSYLKIPGARRVTWNRFHYEIPQILFATATCRPVLCTPVIRDILCIILLFCCLHFSLFPFQLDHPFFIINVPYSICVLGISFLSPFLLRYSFLFFSFSLFLFCLLDVFLPESILAKSLVICVSSGFRRDVNKIFALLRC